MIVHFSQWINWMVRALERPMIGKLMRKSFGVVGCCIFQIAEGCKGSHVLHKFSSKDDVSAEGTQ